MIPDGQIDIDQILFSVNINVGQMERKTKNNRKRFEDQKSVSLCATQREEREIERERKIDM